MRPRHSGSIVSAKLCLGLLAAMVASGLGQHARAQSNQGLPAWDRPPPGQPPATTGAPYPGSLTQGGPIRDGMRVPVGREAMEERQRAAGVAADAERERRQLEELNALSRQLTPPGTPLPAPNLPAQR